MQPTHLVPVEGRRLFYSITEGAFAEYVYAMTAGATRETAAADFSEKERIYFRLALATLDLGLGSTSCAAWLREAALAAKLGAAADPTSSPLGALQALFAFQAGIDVNETSAFAKELAGRAAPRPRPGTASPHVEALVASLCLSLQGDERAAAGALGRIAKLGHYPTKRKAGAAWLDALVALAQVCLLESPRDLSKSLVALATQTAAYFRPDFEDQNFEPCFATVALAFVARARDRGFDVSGPGPHSSMPFELLRQRRDALPDHPWNVWPRPDKKLVDAVTAALRLEEAPVPRPAERRKLNKIPPPEKGGPKLEKKPKKLKRRTCIDGGKPPMWQRRNGTDQADAWT